MADEAIQKCPECGSLRPDLTQVCPACGAPPIRPGEQRATDNEVRTEDLEPYVTLRYIARLFKVLAILMAVMMVGEIVTGLFTEGGRAILNLIGETTRLLVISGLLWAAGDITLLLIDAGHDLRVVRILLGRVNAELHRKEHEATPREPGIDQRRNPR